MEWISDLAEFASSSFGKYAAGLIGLGGSFVAVGFGISNFFSKENTKRLLRKIRFLEEQVEHLEGRLEAEHKSNIQLQDHIQIKQKDLETSRIEISKLAASLTEAKRKLIPYYHSYSKLKPEYDRLKQELASEQEIIKALKHSANETDSKNLDLIEELQKGNRNWIKPVAESAEHSGLKERFGQLKHFRKFPNFALFRIGEMQSFRF